MSESDVYNIDKLDEDKILRMLRKIYKLEKNNARTRDLTDKKMREEIIKIIEEGERQCY